MYNQQHKLTGSTAGIYKMSPISKHDSHVTVLGNQKENLFPQQHRAIDLN